MSTPNEPVTKEQFQTLVTTLGFPSIQPQDEIDYVATLNAAVADLEAVAAMPAYTHPVFQKTKTATATTEETRTYTEPSPEENPLNAWRFRTVIKPASSSSSSSSSSISPQNGLLAGKTVAIKDNISVAGLPLTGGTQPHHLTNKKPSSSSSSSSEAYPYPISTIDAPVITRVLEAGGTITGTSTCENYCMSGLSFTSATGPVDNAWEYATHGKDKDKDKEEGAASGRRGYSTGGSSSGSAALLAVTSVRQWRARHGMAKESDDGLGEGVDFALGGDQGGSIRLPAGYSGIYGLKPTHGLVPYTGCSGLAPAIDHCGPMATSVRDTALLLTVLAGYDGFDPRMTPETPLRNQVPQYHETLDKAIEARRSAGDWTPTTAARGLRIGIIKEAWAAPQLTDDVASAIKKAAARFTELGAAVVDEVSIPLHAVGAKIFTAVTLAGMADTYLRNNPPDLLSWPVADWNPFPTAPDAAAAWYDTMNKSAPTVVNSLFGSTLVSSDKTRFPLAARAKAVTHAHELRAAYDAALDEYDVLLTPATPTVAQRHPDPDRTSVREKQALALGITYNTCPFDLTGHPGLVIPVGWGKKAEKGEEEGGRLPIGMQLVGKRWGEDQLFLAAAAWEVGGLGLDG